MHHEQRSGHPGRGRDELGPGRILAITALDNHASGRLLEKLRFNFERIVTLPGNAEELRLHAAG